MLELHRPTRLIDHHPNFFLDDMLKGICLKIQPLESMIERFESSYKIVEDILRSAPAGSIIHKVDLKVFVQGSILSDTVVKAIHQDEHDLDVVILFKLDHREVNPRAVQDEIYKLLMADDRYKDKVVKKSRCVTIQYNTNFHIDLMPALPEFLNFEDDWILVPHKLSENLYDWQSSNPVGLNKWLTDLEKSYRMDSMRSIVLNEASIEVSPFPKPKRYKSNIRYIIQLLKRARDHYFKDDPDAKKIARSIALLVLTGTHYRPASGSLISELLYVVSKIEDATSNYLDIHVYNPLHLNREDKDREDFAEKWRQDRDLYLKFRKWVKSLREDLQEIYIQRDGSYNQYVDKLKELFHATPVDTLLNEYGDNTRNLQNAGKVSVSPATGTLLYGVGGGIPAPKAKSFGNNTSKEFFKCEKAAVKLPIYAHIEKMRRDFPNFKMSLVKGQRNTVCWVGEVQPELFGDIYKVSVTYKDGYHPAVKILSHDVGKRPKHVYSGNKLCLYHPYAGEGRWKMNEPISSKIIPLTILWIIQWEIWKKTGRWNGDEHPHGDPANLVSAA